MKSHKHSSRILSLLFSIAVICLCVLPARADSYHHSAIRYSNEYRSGYDDGYADGYDDGYRVGEYSGFMEGYEEGEKEGYFDGQLEGESIGYSAGLKDGRAGSHKTSVILIIALLVGIVFAYFVGRSHK